jgi:8-oxo-dGTP pyrophosphatase MutT (NUDIX family)
MRVASARDLAAHAPRAFPNLSSRLPQLAERLAARTPKNQPESGNSRAAVAVVLAPAPDSLLLIQRAEREGDRWSGQLALPGGRWNPGDSDLAATARRETLEEVGVDLAGVPLLGRLDDLEPRTPVLPPLIVRPFVFGLGERAELSLNAEVAAAWWVTLESLQRPGVYGHSESRRYGTLVRSAGYQLEVGLLWGLTERILTSLLGLLP